MCTYDYQANYLYTSLATMRNMLRKRKSIYIGWVLDIIYWFATFWSKLCDQIDHTFHKLNFADNLQKSDHSGNCNLTKISIRLVSKLFFLARFSRYFLISLLQDSVPSSDRILQAESINLDNIELTPKSGLLFCVPVGGWYLPREMNLQIKRYSIFAQALPNGAE